MGAFISLLSKEPASPAPQTSSTDHLKELSQIIAKSVQDLERVCQKGGYKFPTLDEPYDAASEDFRFNPDVSEAAEIVAAAAYQLVSAVLPAPTAFYGLHVSGVNKTACLRVCMEANVVEILRDAGPKGLHVDEIGARCKISSQKLGRILRYLATYHVFKEISPDVFANTRLSSVVDTGKSVEELVADPISKHDNTSGFPAFVSHHLDELYKGSAYLWENLSDPKTGHSDAATETPCNRAFQTDLPMWEFFERKDQVPRFKRFGQAYNWGSLSKDSIVVDVGGGVGTSSLRLAQSYPHLRLVNQDRPQVIEVAKEIWGSKIPKALDSGRAKLQAHDFFAEQPVKDASVFLMKQILHDWSDPYAIQILNRLREVALPTTKLIIVENVVRLACAFPTTEEESKIPGAIPREASSPLLANYGISSTVGYFTDLAMLVGFNAQERTVTQFSALLKKTGWKLVKVGRTDGAFLQSLEAVPV